MGALLSIIKTWIETESGPSYAKFSIPNLQLKVTIMGYKKITLERDFKTKENK